MSAFEACVGVDGDNPALQRLFAVPQPSSGVQIAFERAPDYFASAGVMYQQSHLLLVRHKGDQALAAAVNMGQRLAWINGKKTLLRYGADMRIAPEFQGGRVLLYVNRAVKGAVKDGWYLTVILEGNQRSRNSLEGGRAGLPHYRHLGDISTYTLTSTRGQARLPANIHIRTATKEDIAAMNAWAQRLGQYYQFLPCYDFAELAAGAAFYRGLSLSDFLLLERDGELAGIVGLWDQHGLKQARVVAYNRLMRLLKPFYNIWSRLGGGLVLPPVGQVFRYLSLHSMLTLPDDVTAFSVLLQAALKQAKQRTFCGAVLTLSEQDPRREALRQFRHVRMQARQYSVAYAEANQPLLLPDFIHFHDAGRL